MQRAREREGERKGIGQSDKEQTDALPLRIDNKTLIQEDRKKIIPWCTDQKINPEVRSKGHT